MSAMHRLRSYHAVLAILVLATFVTGEAGWIHAILGYAVGVVIAGRLVAAGLGARQLGLSRFYPRFSGLQLGTALTHPALSRVLLASIAACLIGATVTGIGLDRGHALGLAPPPATAQAEAVRPGSSHDRAEEEDGLLGEGHEALANLLAVLVGLHVGYLLLAKQPLARFMLFQMPPPG